MANFEESPWVWVGMLVFLLYVLFLHVISFIAAFGWFNIPTSIPNSGFFDPTTFKWFFLVGAILAVLFLFYALLVSAALKRTQGVLQQSTSTWHYLLATFFLVLLTIAMWIADGRHNNVTAVGGFGELGAPFTGVPLPYGGNNQLQDYTYSVWTMILVLAVVFTAFIVISTYNGYRTIMFMRAAKGAIAPAPEDIDGKRKKGGKKKNPLDVGLLTGFGN